MSELLERNIDCPYCGESISVLLEESEQEQEYIEDCQVCCRPINFVLWKDIQGQLNLKISNENE